MTRLGFFFSLAIGLFAMLVAIDFIKKDEAFVWSYFLLDVMEKALLALAVATTAHVTLETRGMARQRHDMLNDISRVRGESERWRATARAHVEGLSVAISQQFKDWKLSDSEADIALLMLKGLSQKDIAELRGTEETTVRQQATAVYRKSGLASRTDLAAFFLEDLLLPEKDRPPAPARKLTLVP